MLEKPAEPLLAHDLSRRERLRGRFIFPQLSRGGFRQRNIADTLMRAFLVVMFEEFAGDVAKLFLAQDQEVVEAQIPYRLR